MTDAPLVISEFESGNEEELWMLFFGSVHNVASANYSAEQIEAWAPLKIDPENWSQRIQRIQPWVCRSGDTIVGYADLQPDGLIDHFFVHHEWQRRGVGRRLMSGIHADAVKRKISDLYSHVSITARPFFEHNGFVVEHEQSVRIGDVELTNFLMTKNLSPAE